MSVTRSYHRLLLSFVAWGVAALSDAASLPPENAFTWFDDASCRPQGRETDFRLLDRLAENGFDTVTHTLRGRADLDDPETHEMIRAYADHAHACGLKLYVDVDPRRARNAFLSCRPDGRQGVMRLGVASATNGAAAVRIRQPTLFDHMVFGARRGYDPVTSRLERAWAVLRQADGSVTARPVTAACSDVTADGLTVRASGLEEGESLAVLATFDLWSIDVFSPDLMRYAHELMDKYQRLGVDGGFRDEWGFPPSTFPELAEHRAFWYSPNYALAYERATGGRDLLDDALLFAFPLSGRGEERSRVVTAYMRLNYERNVEIERDFYRTDKQMFGPHAYVCKHPTWYPRIDWHEFFHNGLDWWAAPRDWAQTDETTPLSAACGLTKKWGCATWMNEGYQPEASRYAPLVWRYALAGGRMVFHPVFPGNGERYRKMSADQARYSRTADYLASTRRARECVRLLSRISSAPIDCPVAYVFGHARVCWDWTDPAWGDWGERDIDGLWRRGWGTDLYPSTELSSFTVDETGFLRMGVQRYAVLVLHNLSKEDRAGVEALSAKGMTKTRICESASEVPGYLESLPDIARQTPVSDGLPLADGTVVLTDGTRARIKATGSVEGDPIEGVLVLADGKRYEYAARGLFAVNGRFAAAAGAVRIAGPGVSFSAESPQDVVIPLTP